MYEQLPVRPRQNQIRFIKRSWICRFEDDVIQQHELHRESFVLANYLNNNYYSRNNSNFSMHNPKFNVSFDNAKWCIDFQQPIWLTAQWDMKSKSDGNISGFDQKESMHLYIRITAGQFKLLHPSDPMINRGLVIKHVHRCISCINITTASQTILPSFLGKEGVRA